MGHEPIPIIELKAQIEESVERLASPVEVQRRWIEEQLFPIDELILNFDMCWPLWQTRLREEGAIDSQDVAVLDQLHDYALPLVDPDFAHLFAWETVQDAPEWARIRSLAAEALASLRR